MSDSPYIRDVTDENFDQIVIQGSRERPVLVDFWASWCQPCQMLMPVLAALAGEYQGRFLLAKLNTEENQALAARFGIRSIPNVKLFIDGREVDEFAGALPESAIREFLDRHLPRESDRLVDAALQAHAGGDASGALKILEEARSSDPANPRIPLTMARIRAAEGDLEAAESALEDIPTAERDDPEVARLRSQLFFLRDAPAAEEVPRLEERLARDENDNEARYALALAMVGRQDYPRAIEHLLTLLGKDRQFRDGLAREALLKLFDMLGDDPQVAQARRRLFNMMH